MAQNDLKGFRFRESTRAPFETEVKLSFDRLGGSTTGFSADISMEGMFVKTPEPKAVGTLVQFEFQLEPQGMAIQGLGDVVWIRMRPQGVDKPAGMGIQYRYLDPHSREAIFKIVDGYLKASQGEEGDAPAAGSGAAGAGPAEGGDTLVTGPAGGESPAFSAMDPAAMTNPSPRRPAPSRPPVLPAGFLDTLEDPPSEESPSPPEEDLLTFHEPQGPPPLAMPGPGPGAAPGGGRMRIVVAVLLLVALTAVALYVFWPPASELVSRMLGEEVPDTVVADPSTTTAPAGPAAADSAATPASSPGGDPSLPSPSGGEVDPMQAAVPATPLSAIDDIRWTRTAAGTEVTIRGNGFIARESFSLDRIGGASPRLLVKVRGVSKDYSPRNVEVGTGELQRIRTAVHDGSVIWLVFDLNGQVEAEALTDQGEVVVRLTAGGGGP